MSDALVGFIVLAFLVYSGVTLYLVLTALLTVAAELAPRRVMIGMDGVEDAVSPFGFVGLMDDDESVDEDDDDEE